MWLYLSLASALLLGFYDIFKKRSLQKNGVMWVLVGVTALSTLLLLPFFRLGTIENHLLLIPKGLLVALSWISGLIAMKTLPLTTISTIKASRPVFVVLLSILLFGEALNLWQWLGVTMVFTALWMLSRSSEKEGISFKKNKGIWWIIISVFAGVASALYDKQLVSRVEMDPMFVLCWSNLYILAVLCMVLGTRILIHKGGSVTEISGEKGRKTPLETRERFRWDWNLLVTAIIIVAADTLYFQALAQEGSMLSIVSMIRRCSVVVTFAGSAIMFKEHNIKDKAIDLAILLAGVAILVFLT